MKKKDIETMVKSVDNRLAYLFRLFEPIRENICRQAGLRCRCIPQRKGSFHYVNQKLITHPKCEIHGSKQPEDWSIIVERAMKKKPAPELKCRCINPLYKHLTHPDCPEHPRRSAKNISITVTKEDLPACPLRVQVAEALGENVLWHDFHEKWVINPLNDSEVDDKWHCVLSYDTEIKLAMGAFFKYLQDNCLNGRIQYHDIEKTIISIDNMLLVEVLGLPSAKDVCLAIVAHAKK